MALVLCAAFAAPMAQAEKKIYPHRWVYVSRGLTSDQDVEDIRRIAQTAADSGLTALALSARMDAMDLKPPEYFRRLAEVKRICDNLKLEIIPHVFSTGYGGSVLAHDKNLAAGLPVRDALFIAGEGEARFTEEDPVRLQVTSSEDHLTQEIRVKPYRCYRFRLRVKTEGVKPRTAFSVRAFTEDGRDMSRYETFLPETSDGRELYGAFNSWYAEKIRIDMGVRRGAGGKVWIENLRVEEAGLTNVLRRPGTPIRVRNEKTGMEYREGKDFSPIADPNLNFRWDHDGPAIRLLPGGTVRPGDRLRVSYFHGTTIYRDQVVVCMSEPKLYEIWEKQIPLIEKHVRPTKYFLSMDEVRIGGHCEACRKRKLGMAEILGDCLTRKVRMIRQANPKAEIFVWSDMLDPNHNARPNYYMVDGDLSGSWKYAPKDLRIVCWYFDKRRASLDHFSKLGFQTLAGAYYDGDDLSNPQGWLEALDVTPGATGIMYTTWENKYKLLADFGALVTGRR